MNDELDALVSLYARASCETPSPMVDARILRAAERVAQRRRGRRQMAWPVAIAAAVLLWMGVHAISSPQATAPVYHDAQLAADLSHLDVTPAYSDVTRHLLDRAPPGHDNLALETQP